MKKKKILAREILIFFSATMLVLIVWGAIAVRNTYYQHQISLLDEKIQAAYVSPPMEKPHTGPLVEITDPDLLEGEEVPTVAPPESKEKIEIDHLRWKLIDDETLQSILLITSIILASALYPLRFTVLVIQWAIKTIKISSA